jgi:hypothetical protein
MKKLKSGGAPKGRGNMSKYIKLAVGAYLLDRFKSGKVEKEIKTEIKPEEMIMSKAVKVKTGKGSSMGIGKMIFGALAGATLVYALKKRAAKKRSKIDVE